MTHLKTRADTIRNDDAGVVAILVALLAVVLFGMAAFAVDAALAYSSKRELSAAVDGAALSGAQSAGLLFPVGQGCDSTRTAMQSAAGTAAAQTYSAALPANSAGYDDVAVDCLDTNGDSIGDTVEVRVSASARWESIFAGVLGVDQLNPSARATARITGAPAYGGLRPFAVCIDDVEPTTSTTAQSEYTSSGSGPDTTNCGAAGVPGNWGTVDFGGGSNPTGDLATWTADGYPGPVTIPDPALPGDPGSNFSSGQVRDALTSIVGDTVLFPVADSWSESGGDNASFNAVGVVSAEICGFAMRAPREVVVGDCWDQAQADAAFADTSGSRPDLVIQWVYRDYVTSFAGGSGAGCDLATDPACVPTVRLYE